MTHPVPPFQSCVPPTCLAEKRVCKAPRGLGLDCALRWFSAVTEWILERTVSQSKRHRFSWPRVKKETLRGRGIVTVAASGCRALV